MLPETQGTLKETLKVTLQETLKVILQETLRAQNAGKAAARDSPFSQP